MSRYLGLVVVALAVGCTDEAIETGVTSQALTRSCPDPDNCLVSNGGGSYTEELGNAGIGPNDFMITHFMNLGTGNSASVAFQGRGLNPATGMYTTRGGVVYNARFYGGTYLVKTVTETLTQPTFTLTGPNGDFTVTGNGLANLKLVLSFDGQLWTLAFSNPALYPGPSQNDPVLHDFDAQWSLGEPGANPTHPYCYRAQTAAGVPPLTDPVVFQQGINVNPITTVMTHESNYVTLSCLHGAMAQVRSWGYVYRGDADQTIMFEAAMHMKRASYCGDEAFFTRANTTIYIWDDVGVETSTQLTGAGFEASWGQSQNGTIRALCVHMANRRRPAAVYPPPVWALPGGEFDGTCTRADNSTFTIPECGNTAPAAWGHLADQRSP
jgi:hypothetical protein